LSCHKGFSCSIWHSAQMLRVRPSATELCGACLASQCRSMRDAGTPFGGLPSCMRRVPCLRPGTEASHCSSSKREVPTSQVDEDRRPQLGIAQPCEPRRQSHGKLASRDRAIWSRGHLEGRGHGQGPESRPVACKQGNELRDFVGAGRWSGGPAPRLATSGHERMRCYTNGLICRVSFARARRRAL